MRRGIALALSGCVVVAVVVAVALVVSSIRRSDAAPRDGVVWTLTDLAVDGQARPLVTNAPVTLTFHSGPSTVTGSTSCNSYQATYQATGTHIAFANFAVSAVGCPSAVGAQENLYLQALTRVSTLNQTGDTLLLSSADGKHRLRFTAVHP